MSTTTAAPLDPAHINAPPQHGNFTYDAGTHIQLAESLATILCGEGAGSFNTFKDSTRDDVLFLLTCEIRRARQALAAESTRALSSKEGAR